MNVSGDDAGKESRKKVQLLVRLWTMLIAAIKWPFSKHNKRYIKKHVKQQQQQR